MLARIHNGTYYDILIAFERQDNARQKKRTETIWRTVGNSVGLFVGNCVGIFEGFGVGLFEGR